MAEEKAGTEPGQDIIGAGADPTATAMVLGSASRCEADAFLREQLVQCARAAQLDLTAEERFELRGMRHV